MCLSVAAIKKNDALNWYDCVWKLRIAAFVSLSVVVVVVVPVAIIRTTAPGSFDRGIDTITRSSSSSSSTVESGVASMSMTRIGENEESPTNGIGNGGDPQIDLDGLNSNHPQQQQQQQEDPSNQLPPQWHKLSTYDLTRSTEMNYKMDLQKGFTGRYTHVRSTLDYTYHSNYIPQRQLLQDSIIDLLLTNGNGMDHTHNHNNNRDDNDDDDDSRNDKHTNRQQPQHTNPTNTKTTSSLSSPSQSSNNTPWIVFTAGAMGAGKSYTIRHLASTTPQRFPLQRFITVDPDEIRRLLPEFDSYLTPPTATATEEGGSSTHRPELAGELTRKEAGMIAEILAEVALGEGRNVLVDGSLKDSDWYRGYFDRLRNEYGGDGGGGLRIGILHVTAPRDAIFERARIRAKTTGRIVPQHTLEESIEKVPKSIRLLAPLVDFFAQLHNAPNATDVELVTEGMTWESFRQVWSPTTTTTTRCSSIYPTLRTTTNTIDSGDAVNAWDNELDNNIFFGYHQATAAAATCSNRDAAEVVRDEFFGYRWQQDQVLSRL